ncbi:MAG: putative glycosylhydrolase, partial [Verrucomicrobiales bacterium]|nr:putative glycosylhydrolase [Verrucomicrobiales bacterium]
SALWKPPFTVKISDALKPGRNHLKIKVTNLWPNRLIGDEQFPDDCTPDGSWLTGRLPQWPEWLLKSQPRPEPRRQAFTTWKYYTKDSPLLSSGLLGPVTLR